jgi:hypothetical protein
MSHGRYEDTPRTGTFRVPGEGAMLRKLARRGIVRERAASSPGANAPTSTEMGAMGLNSRVKSPRYRPIPRVTPMRGKQ